MDQFQTPQRFIDRARHHFGLGHTEFLKCQNNGTFAFVMVRYPDTQEKILKFKQIKDFSPAVEMALSDAITNARHSFDQSLFAACVAIGQPRRKVNYPWARNPDQDLNHLLTGKNVMPNVPTELWSEIRRQQPYPSGQDFAGGNSVIREVARLANRKHSIGFEFNVAIDEMSLGSVVATGGVSFFYAWNQAEREIDIVRCDKNSKVHIERPEVQININFRDSELLASACAFSAIQRFIDKSQQVLDGLKAESVLTNK